MLGRVRLESCCRGQEPGQDTWKVAEWREREKKGEVSKSESYGV